MTTTRLIDAALREGIQIGQVAEVQFTDDGVTPIRLRDLDDFVYDWCELMADGGTQWNILTNRAYVGVVHSTGAFLVEV